MFIHFICLNPITNYSQKFFSSGFLSSKDWNAHSSPLSQPQPYINILCKYNLGSANFNKITEI